MKFGLDGQETKDDQLESRRTDEKWSTGSQKQVDFVTLGTNESKKNSQQKKYTRAFGGLTTGGANTRGGTNRGLKLKHAQSNERKKMRGAKTNTQWRKERRESCESYRN